MANNITLLSDKNDTSTDFEYQAPFKLILAMLIIGLVGITGNFLTLAVVFRKKTLTSVSFLIVLMSVFDICAILSLLSVPIQKVIVGDILPLTFYFQDFFITGSSLAAAIIGCERSFAIRKPLKFREIWNIKITIGLCFVCFLFFLVLIVSRVIVEMFSRNKFKEIMFLIYFGIIRGVPCLVIFVSNILMTTGLRRKNICSRYMDSREQDKERVKSESSITLTVLSITITYFLCMLPSRFALGLKFSGVLNDSNDIVFHIASIVEIFNFSVNFILYTITSKFFRKEYLNLLFCRSRHSDLSFTSSERLNNVDENNRF